MSNKRNKEPTLVCFEGSMINIEDATLSTESNLIMLKTNDEVVSGTIYFKSEAQASVALEKIRNGDLFYVSSKEYLNDLPVNESMEEEWKELLDLGLVGMDMYFCGHRKQWGERIRIESKDFELN